MNPKEAIQKALALLGSAIDGTVADAQDLEARAREAGLATKAADIDAGEKALTAVKALEDKLASAETLIAKQAEHILALETSMNTRLGGIEAGQKAQAERAVKALDEVKGLLTTLNVKAEPAAPDQAAMAAAEAATKAKVNAAQTVGNDNGLALKRFTRNGTTAIAEPLQ